MENYVVKDLMVPLSEYATVREGSTLFEAVEALEKAQEEYDHSQYRHRAVLVMNARGLVIGKLSHLDALRALEPIADEANGITGLAEFGFSAKFVRKLSLKQRLGAESLETLCRRGRDLKVEACMQATVEGECIDEETSLDIAIHQLVFGNHLSLLAMRDGSIVGILRLSDVFAAVFHYIRSSIIQ